MKLECIRIGEIKPALLPSPATRKWMDDFPDRHAYRCLPLAIANAHGWDVLCPFPVEVTWNGGPTTADVTVKALDPDTGKVQLEHFARSNFSRGIVTIWIGHTSICTCYAAVVIPGVERTNCMARSASDFIPRAVVTNGGDLTSNSRQFINHGEIHDENAGRIAIAQASAFFCGLGGRGEIARRVSPSPLRALPDLRKVGTRRIAFRVSSKRLSRPAIMLAPNSIYRRYFPTYIRPGAR